MQILVDADALPNAVQKVLFRAVERVGVPTVLVTNQYLRVPKSKYISSMTVPPGPDIADDQIVEMAQEGDLVVTADIPLADRVVTKGAYALNPRGELYTDDNVKDRLATRDLMSGLRDGGMITGGPPEFNPKNVQAFANQLDRFLTKHCRS